MNDLIFAYKQAKKNILNFEENIFKSSETLISSIFENIDSSFIEKVVERENDFKNIIFTQSEKERLLKILS